MTTADTPPKPIFSRENMPDQETFFGGLRDLTQKTAATHTVHSFVFESWGHAIVNVVPYPEAGNVVAKMYLHSPVPIKDGDLIDRGPRGLSFVFDVVNVGNPKDMYELHAVRSAPQIGIGHDVNAPKSAGTALKL